MTLITTGTRDCGFRLRRDRTKKGKVFPVHVDVYLHSLSARWRWEVNFTLWPLYPWEKPRYPLNRRLGGFQNRSKSFWGTKKIFAITGTRNLDRQNPYPSHYQRIVAKYTYWFYHVCPYVRIEEKLIFFLNFGLYNFVYIFNCIQILFKIGQQSLALYMKTCLRFCVNGRLAVLNTCQSEKVSKNTAAKSKAFNDYYTYLG